MVPKLLPGGPRVFPERSFCSKRSFRKEAGEENGPGCGQKTSQGSFRKDLLEERDLSGKILGCPLAQFWLPGRPPEGPGEAPGGHFGGIFAERPGGTKKVINLSEFSLFLAPFFGCILFQFLRLPGGAGARAHLRKTGFHSEGVAFFACPAFARGTKKRRNFEEKQ